MGVRESSEGAKIEAPQAPRGVRYFRIYKIKMTCFGALWSMDFILNVPAREGSWRLDVFITTVKLEENFIH